jgi:hypothetical protein
LTVGATFSQYVAPDEYHFCFLCCTSLSLGVEGDFDFFDGWASLSDSYQNKCTKTNESNTIEYIRTIIIFQKKEQKLTMIIKQLFVGNSVNEYILLLLYSFLFVTCSFCSLSSPGPKKNINKVNHKNIKIKKYTTVIINCLFPFKYLIQVDCTVML